MVYEEGPYVQVACFCDQVIEDKSGTLSLIRIIDTITRSVSDPHSPEEMPPFTHALTLVLSLKSGSARGRGTLSITPEMPTGEVKEPLDFTVHFDGEERGSNIILRINFLFQYEGLYWFDVRLNDKKFTAIPLRIRYDRTLARIG